MSHIHSSSGCACCSAMGVTFAAYQPTGNAPEVRKDRVTTQGMEHIYVVDETVHVEIVETSILGVAEEIADVDHAEDREALQAVIQQQLSEIKEQSQRLESASYRIGYLEGQLSSKDEQLKLLCDSSSSPSWWDQFCKWFK